MNPESGGRDREAGIIARAMRGEATALRELIDDHKDRLHAFVWRLVRNHHEAEELCQESFLKAFASLQSFNIQYRFSTWLFTIAYRLCLNQMRRKRSFTGEVDFTVFADHQPDVSDGAAQSEEAVRLKKLIWGAVDQLSVPQRAAVLLFYRQEQSCSEIAQVLQLPVSTVKSHLHRARAHLKEMLEPALGGNFGGLRIFSQAAG